MGSGGASHHGHYTQHYLTVPGLPPKPTIYSTSPWGTPSCKSQQRLGFFLPLPPACLALLTLPLLYVKALN